MKKFFLLATVFFFCAQGVLAQVNSNDFTIRTLVGGDTVPPSTPTLLSVDPVAATQIDLSWSSSTDNYAVAGYSVVRDGTPIATTTLLSYSDTGLSASTTYAYIVRAFDAVLNYSSSSNSISTTTPDNPPPPSNPDTTQEGTTARIVVKDFFIDTGVSTSSFHLNTARPARVEVRWGRTVSYELGYVVSNTYTREHAVLLTDLEPGTIYEYEVIGYSPRGVQSVIRTGTFTTLSKSQVVSPANVARFQAVQNGNDVDLSWQLPASGSLSHVRVVRSHLGFPEHPQDGAIVYQGLKTSVRDMAVLAQYSPVYYTAFVYDTSGNISSGAVAIVYDSRPTAVGGEVGDLVSPGGMTITPGTDRPIIDVPEVTDQATTSINLERVTVDMKMPQPSEIEVIQGKVRFTLLDSDMALNSEQPFVVSIPSEAVARNLKSIIVTLLDPTNNKTAHSYLLRINQDQTAYEATIPAFLVAGRSQLRVEIYDYEAFVVASYQTPLTFSNIPTEMAEEVVFPDMVFERPYVLGLIIVLPLAIILILLLVYRQRDEDNNDEV